MRQRNAKNENLNLIGLISSQNFDPLSSSPASLVLTSFNHDRLRKAAALRLVGNITVTIVTQKSEMHIST